MSKYRRVSVDGRVVAEHRAVWEAAHGPIPEGYVVHHINGIKDDNRLENLECMEMAQHLRLHTPDRHYESQSGENHWTAKAHRNYSRGGVCGRGASMIHLVSKLRAAIGEDVA